MSVLNPTWPVTVLSGPYVFRCFWVPFPPPPASPLCEVYFRLTVVKGTHIGTR